MRKVILLTLWVFLSFTAYSQVSGEQINGLVETFKANGESEEAIKARLNGLITSPELYNSLWKNFIDQAVGHDSIKWKFLRDLNVQFKTFQTENNPANSLGFTYDFNFDYASFKENNHNRISNSFGLSATGNVAIDKKFNPSDFLETKVHYSYAHFNGGVVTKSNREVFLKLDSIEDLLVAEKDIYSERSQKLWEEFGKNLELSNQYYYGISPKFAFESNRDFSAKQFTPGIAINLGAKAWNNSVTLSKLNIFDYPFAVLRLITGTDKHFTPYGSTLPIVAIVLDYVVPSSDSVRSKFAGNLNAYPRIKFETGFRTFITRIKRENIFFNANYRYYQELNAPEEIKKEELDTHSYFVMALQSTSGFYVSYANGKLPFDAKKDEIYSIGFSYKFD